MQRYSNKSGRKAYFGRFRSLLRVGTVRRIDGDTFLLSFLYLFGFSPTEVNRIGDGFTRRTRCGEIVWFRRVLLCCMPMRRKCEPVERPYIPSSSFSTNTICFAGGRDDLLRLRVLDGTAIMPASLRISSSSSPRPASSSPSSCASSVRFVVKRSASALS